jgi:glycosyltransferase involved in cell wall biosynthesis
MAHGLPVIATPCCGEVVQDGINGVVVPAGDAAVLAEAIRGLAREPQRLAAMSRAALETVGDFGIDRVGDGLLGGVRASAQ